MAAEISGLVLGPEINYENVIEHRADELNEGLMFRVCDVGVAVLLAFEGKDEAVGETFVLFFFADVRASFQGDDLGDLLF